MNHMAAKRKQWAADLDLIRNAAHTLFLYRDIWGQYQEMFLSPGVPWSDLFDWQFRWYSNAQANAIRRITDRHSFDPIPKGETDGRPRRRTDYVRASPSAVSMENLLSDIATAQTEPDPPLNREWWCSEWMRNSHIQPEFQKYEAAHASGAFDALAGEREPAIPASLVVADRDALRERGAPVKRFVDQHIAHSDRDPVAEAPTLREVNAFIDRFGDLVKRYHSVLHPGESLMWLLPDVQSDWKAPFRNGPWIS